MRFRSVPHTIIKLATKLCSIILTHRFVPGNIAPHFHVLEKHPSATDVLVLYVHTTDLQYDILYACACTT